MPAMGDSVAEGTVLEWHKHEGETVEADETLVEISTDLLERGPLRTTHLTSGSRKSFGPLHVHEVWNPNGATAYSVHVYSPPIRELGHYELTDGLLRRTPRGPEDPSPPSPGLLAAVLGASG